MFAIRLVTHISYLEQSIVDLSVRWGVLCRLTAFVAVEERDHRQAPTGDVPLARLLDDETVRHTFFWDCAIIRSTG